MKGKADKLRLNRETVRHLTDEALGRAAAGGELTPVIQTLPVISCITCDANTLCELTYQPRCF